MTAFFSIKLQASPKIIISFGDACVSSNITKGFTYLLGIPLRQGGITTFPEANICYLRSQNKNECLKKMELYNLDGNLWYSFFQKKLIKFNLHCISGIPQEKTLFYHRIIDFSISSAVLRGSKIAVVHGALLELPDGRGVLLHAESGVGKSTTSRRWEAAGGKYTADDMILLEYDTPEGIIAHPLPTWSRCQQSLEGLCYPIEKCIPLAGLLVLSRAKGDEPEAIRPIPYPEFLCQVYQSCIYFHKLWIKIFPEAEQRQLIANNQACARKLCSLFPPRALMARLDGDLRETLKEFL